MGRLLEDASHGHADPDGCEGAEEEVPGTEEAGAQDAREETSPVGKSLLERSWENPWDKKWGKYWQTSWEKWGKSGKIMGKS